MTKPRTRTHATARITEQNSEAAPNDQTTSPALMEIRLNETFDGDMDGESPVRALQVRSFRQPGQLPTIPRKTRRAPRHFVLQGQEVVQNGKIKASWFVVPGSGANELSGLRGRRLCWRLWKRSRRNFGLLV